MLLQLCLYNLRNLIDIPENTVVIILTKVAGIPIGNRFNKL